jgi:hypothetical protein
MIASEDLTHSRALWHHASEFKKASVTIQKSDEHGPHDRIAYYLICHSIELSLKAFLRGKGSAILELRKLGHNLQKLIKESDRNQLQDYVIISMDHRAALLRANEYYLLKELEYPVIGPKNLPTIELLNSLADELSRAIKDFCHEKETAHDGKPTAERNWLH